jgi:sterol desaturase/sphingolipid hydroxylase (fatty acid hydroxylase superfamily)
MEKYGKFLLIIMPVFIILIVIEKLYGLYVKKERMNHLDTASSLTSSITMITKNVLGISFTILSYQWIEERVALTHIQSTWATYLIAFVVLDFSHYWIHRIEHANNFFWNSHIVHHSSEEFDLACAVRQPISSFVKIFTLFMLPAALLGISPIVIATVTPIQFFAQFWYHTRYIKRMGFLEHLIVTPSHHRVHHAINEEYLDKNYSQIFIIWDKLFGTFQEEQKAIPPVYGITRPMRTWNPIKINFVHMWLLIKDTWRAKRWMDKIHVWTKPTGWRPAEVDEKYPVFKIEDVYNFEKYSFKRTPLFLVWIWAQIGILFLITAYLLSHITTIGIPNMFFYGGFIFIYVYALTDLMDGNASAVFWEILKACYGISILFAIGDWFGLEGTYSHSNTIVIAYFILSILMTLYLGKQREKQFELQH